MGLLKKWKWPLIALVVVAALAVIRRAVRGVDYLSLSAARVPLQPLVIQKAPLTERFPESFPLQVALFLTQGDEGGLGAVHALREMGIPFFATHDLSQAMKHRLILVSPWVDAKTFTDHQVQDLTRFVEQGGTIYANDVFPGTLKPLFGFTAFTPARTRHWVSFRNPESPVLKYLDRPEEKRVRLGSLKVSSIFVTNGYRSDGTSEVLAQFDDGSAALLHKSIGKGNVYLSGVRLDDVVLRGQTNRESDGEPSYVNAFDPSADVWVLILRAWYETFSPDGVRMATIPNGQRSVVLLSHDVDWEYSVPGALEFAALEKRHHVKSTYFIQTKYVSDANSRAFFYGRYIDEIRELKAQGFDIGSHSVIHSRAFNHFPRGPDDQTYANYRPHATSTQAAEGGTVMGEIRVSKQLLDGNLPGQHTIFFRSGHLKFASTQAEVLERCGYEFDSSFTAPDVMTNFPYVLTLDRGFTNETTVYEFPITIEDEASSLEGRVAQTLDVIEANAANGAPSVILIHPNDPKGKIPAEEAILNQLPAGIAVSDLDTFAHFWRARDRLEWSARATANARDMILQISPSEAVSGLTFEFARPVESADGGAHVKSGHAVALPDLQAGAPVTFHIHLGS